MGDVTTDETHTLKMNEYAECFGGHSKSRDAVRLKVVSSLEEDDCWDGVNSMDGWASRNYSTVRYWNILSIHVMLPNRNYWKEVDNSILYSRLMHRLHDAPEGTWDDEY